PERTVLEDLLRGADLLYDATAERGLQHLLADLARTRNLTYVSVHATNGAWGGRVLRLNPAADGPCWNCLQHHLADGLVAAPMQRSPEDWVQPEGCASPTFVGASFDLSEVSIAGVRAAVATLQPASAGSPADVRSEVAVVSLRDEQ